MICRHYAIEDGNKRAEAKSRHNHRRPRAPAPARLTSEKRTFAESPIIRPRHIRAKLGELQIVLILIGSSASCLECLLAEHGVEQELFQAWSARLLQ